MTERKLWQGISPTMRDSLPTETEKRTNETLRRELLDQGTFETPAETQTRVEVINTLRLIANKFVAMVAERIEPKNTTLIRDARGFIFTYGSYRLGVVSSGSDIDTIVVAPKYVTLDHFFELFPTLLREMTQPGDIQDMKAVPTAFVPIIKFEFRGISIDLIFSCIKSLKQLPANKDWNLQDVNILRGMDDTLVAALNGPRVTDEILRCVPEEATFRLALRAIKLWAKRRGLYGAINGYPGGVAWAICVARVCQLYPRVTASVIVYKFFFIMEKWRWPQPVLLKEPEDFPLGLRTWNPQIYHGNRRHIMPIITPVYPSFCTTHNVIRSSLTVIQAEFARGLELTEAMVEGKRPWKELFDRHTFFTHDYKYYLTVTSMSKKKSKQTVWSGYIESRYRHLAAETENNPAIEIARPSVDSVERIHRCKTLADMEAVENGSLSFVLTGAELEAAKAEIAAEEAREAKEAAEAAATQAAAEEGKPVDIKESDVGDGERASNGSEAGGNPDGNPDGNAENGFLVFTTTHFIGLKLKEHAKQIDLAYACNKFTRECQMSDLFDPKINKLRIQHIRNFDLPDEVFKPGEIKPTRPPKQLKKRTAPTDDADPMPTKKRQQTAAVSAA